MQKSETIYVLGSFKGMYSISFKPLPITNSNVKENNMKSKTSVHFPKTHTHVYIYIWYINFKKKFWSNFFMGIDDRHAWSHLSLYRHLYACGFFF